MGGKYDIKAENVGAIGDRAHAENFTQVSQPAGGGSLAADLEKLRGAMLKEASESEHYAAVANVKAAEEEAKRGDENKALEYLKKAGQWTLEIATKIGVPIAIEAIKKQTGI